MSSTWSEAARDLIYPPRCPFCDRVLGTRLECDGCQEKMKTLERTRFRLDETEHFLQGLEGAAGVYHYQDEVRRGILRMKYSGRACYGEVLGRILASRLFGCTFEFCGGIIKVTSAPPVGLEYDMIVPVPPSNKRRGFNPPERIARPLAQALGLPLEAKALTKIRRTPRQEGLSRDMRLTNVLGAFRADPERIPMNSRVLLVDDVITTGATIVACTAALKQAGAQSVFALSAAVSETVTEEQNQIEQAKQSVGQL